MIDLEKQFGKIIHTLPENHPYVKNFERMVKIGPWGGSGKYAVFWTTFADHRDGRLMEHIEAKEFLTTIKNDCRNVREYVMPSGLEISDMDAFWKQKYG